MNIKSNKALSVGLIAVFGIVFLLSTLAMSPSQTTATPTVAVPLTNTVLPTVTLTPTAILSPTPTIEPLTASKIDDVLQDDFAKINSSLEEISNKTDPTHATNIIDNLISNGIWAIMVGLSAALGLTNIFVRAKVKQDKAQGKVSKFQELPQSLVSGSWFILFMVIVYFLIPLLLFFGQSIIQSNGQTELVSISQKLDQIGHKLDSLASATPISNSDILPPSTQVVTDIFTGNSVSTPQKEIPDWRIPSIISVGFLVLFLALAGFISRNQAKFYEINVSKLKWEELGKKLLPAIFLVLIIYLLPDPIEAILLPILIPFFLFSFFDVVLLYPNSQLQAFVGKHYSKIIFLTIFGVWYRVFSLLQSYLYPLWNIASDYLQQFAMEYATSQQGTTLYPTSSVGRFLFELPSMTFQLAWSILPFILAILYAIFPWRRIRKISEEKYVSKIINAAKVKSK